jgi:hypothetical protein
VRVLGRLLPICNNRHQIDLLHHHNYLVDNTGSSMVLVSEEQEPNKIALSYFPSNNIALQEQPNYFLLR